MGMYDTLQQAATPQASVVNGTSAQKQPLQQNAYAQKKQMQSVPSAIGGLSNMPQNTMNSWQAKKNSMSQTPNPMTGARPMMSSLASKMGQMGSRPDIMRRNQAPPTALEPAKGLAPTQGMTEIYGQTPQSGIANLQTPYDKQQQQELNPAPAPSPMQAAAKQMEGYAGPDLGSQDPRELARMQSLQAPPFGGENIPPVSNAFQEMLARSQGARPDVVSRGLGPNVIMDENGLEPRRGAR
jgi:hypothetical protein